MSDKTKSNDLPDFLPMMNRLWSTINFIVHCDFYDGNEINIYQKNMDILEFLACFLVCRYVVARVLWAVARYLQMNMAVDPSLWVLYVFDLL